MTETPEEMYRRLISNICTTQKEVELHRMADYYRNQAKVLREALEFYADKENTSYDVPGVAGCWEYWDDGDMDKCNRAKQALEATTDKWSE